MKAEDARKISYNAIPVSTVKPIVDAIGDAAEKGFTQVYVEAPLEHNLITRKWLLELGYSVRDQKDPSSSAYGWVISWF